MANSGFSVQAHLHYGYAALLYPNPAKVTSRSPPRGARFAVPVFEIIHLEPAIQQDLRTAWRQLMIAPVEKFLARTLPAESSTLSHCLLATFFINIATFAAARVTQFDRAELIALAIAAAQGLEQAALTS